MNAQLLALAANWRVVAGANENSSRGHDDHSLTAALLTNCARELEAALAAPKEAGALQKLNPEGRPCHAFGVNANGQAECYWPECSCYHEDVQAAPLSRAGESLLALADEVEEICQGHTALKYAEKLRALANPPGDQRQEGAIYEVRHPSITQRCDGGKARFIEHKHLQSYLSAGWTIASPPPEAAAAVGDRAQLLRGLEAMAENPHDLRPEHCASLATEALAALASPTGVDVLACHAIVSDECRNNRSNIGAANEAIGRLFDSATDLMEAWPIGRGAKLHFKLSVEYPKGALAARDGGV